MTKEDLKALFLRYRREVQAYLARRLRDYHAAADLTQETFLHYAEDRARGEVLDTRAYLYRTAHNLAVDHARRQRRRQTFAVPHEDLAGLPAEQPSPEEAAAARQGLERLRLAIAELPQRTREIFVLNRIHGLSHQEVARRLGISESSVQKHLAKALLHAQRRLVARDGAKRL